jgi:hypothetical protein
MNIFTLLIKYVLMNYKILIPLLIFLTLSFPILSQNIVLKNDSGSYSLKLDTLKIQNIETVSKSNWYESNAMPWITAILISFISVGINIIVSRRSALLQFHSSTTIANKKEWINSIRNYTTDFVTQSKIYNIELQSHLKNPNIRSSSLEKLTSSRNQLLQLLNPSISLQKNVIESIGELIVVIDTHLLNSDNKINNFDNFDFLQKSNKVLTDSRILLSFEWQEIEKITF